MDLVKNNTELTLFLENGEFPKILRETNILNFVNDFKKDQVDNVSGTVKDITRQVLKIGENAINFAKKNIEEAERVAEVYLGDDYQSLKKQVITILVDIFKNESWRVRERALMNQYMIRECKRSVSPKILKDVDIRIQNRKVREIKPEVRQVINHPSYVKKIVEILQSNWETQSEKTKEEFQEYMNKIARLRDSIETQKKIRRFVKYFI